MGLGQEQAGAVPPREWGGAGEEVTCVAGKAPSCDALREMEGLPATWWAVERTEDGCVALYIFYEEMLGERVRCLAAKW